MGRVQFDLGFMDWYGMLVGYELTTPASRIGQAARKDEIGWSGCESEFSGWKSMLEDGGRGLE